MGKYDFAAQRVAKRVSSLIAHKRITNHPPWLDSVKLFPPSERLVRPALQSGKKRQRASRMFQPVKIRYPEDELRAEFFGDHPWELARPRIVLEDDGKDYQKQDWSRIEAAGRQLNGESVIQRQAWLMENKNMSKNQAYDNARREFYKLREQGEIERRISREEALFTGAEFGPRLTDVGMAHEDVEYEKWKAWAKEQNEINSRNNAASYTGLEMEDTMLEVNPLLEEGAEEEKENDSKNRKKKKA